MTLAKAAMKMCDDCSKSDRPLNWYGPNIRICEPCASIRDKERQMRDKK